MAEIISNITLAIYILVTSCAIAVLSNRIKVLTEKLEDIKSKVKGIEYITQINNRSIIEKFSEHKNTHDYLYSKIKELSVLQKGEEK